MCLQIPVVIELNNYYRDNPKNSAKWNARSIWPYSKQSKHNFYCAINRVLPDHNILLLLVLLNHIKIYDKFITFNKSLLMNKIEIWHNEFDHARQRYVFRWTYITKLLSKDWAFPERSSRKFTLGLSTNGKETH